jgi:hypothetical protein
MPRTHFLQEIKRSSRQNDDRLIQYNRNEGKEENTMSFPQGRLGEHNSAYFAEGNFNQEAMTNLKDL